MPKEGRPALLSGTYTYYLIPRIHCTTLQCGQSNFESRTIIYCGRVALNMLASGTVIEFHLLDCTLCCMLCVVVALVSRCLAAVHAEIWVRAWNESSLRSLCSMIRHGWLWHRQKTADIRKKLDRRINQSNGFLLAYHNSHDWLRHGRDSRHPNEAW